MHEVEFLQFVVENLVTHKEDVKIDRIEDDLGVLLTLEVNKEDMGIVIGKGGNTVSALKTLLRLIGAKTNTRINLKVND